MARENVELVRYFLDQGADTEKLDDKGCTHLHSACKLGRYYRSLRAHTHLSEVFFSCVLLEDPYISEIWNNISTMYFL